MLRDIYRTIVSGDIYKIKLMLRDIYKMMRRRLIYWFFPWYILKSIKKRKGSCSTCEKKCCSLKLSWTDYGCKYWINEKCTVFGTDKMPTTCFLYPIDEKDPWDNTKCEFYWYEKK